MGEKMKKVLFVVACVLLLAQAAAAETFTAKVRFIPDGDTIILNDGRRVRLVGIDAPETVKKDKPAQLCAAEAKAALAELVNGRELRIRAFGHDRYGRILGLVVLPDGRVANEALLLEGLAFFYWHEDLPREVAGRYPALQREALRTGEGCWDEVLSAASNKGPYVGNRRSRRFHAPGCPGAARVGRRNRVAFETLEEAFAAGYAPARTCSPWPTVR